MPITSFNGKSFNEYHVDLQSIINWQNEEIIYICKVNGSNMIRRSFKITEPTIQQLIEIVNDALIVYKLIQ